MSVCVSSEMKFYQTGSVISSFLCMAAKSSWKWAGCCTIEEFSWLLERVFVVAVCSCKVEVCGGNTVLLANKLVSKFSLLDIFAAIRPWRSSCPSALPLFICSSTSKWLERHNVQNTSRKVNHGYSLNWVQSDQQAQTFQSCQSHPFLEAYTNCICKLPKIMSLHPL